MDQNKESEPYYFIALVIKGSEKQYLDLIGYLNNQNNSQIIYQRKSLTYLRVVSGDGKFEADAKELGAQGVMH
jgi:hypothetical protein